MVRDQIFNIISKATGGTMQDRERAVEECIEVLQKDCANEIKNICNICSPEILFHAEFFIQFLQENNYLIIKKS